MHLQNFFASAADIPSARALIASRRFEEGTPASSSAAASAPLVWQGEVTAANADQVWENTEAHILRQAASRREVVVDLASLRFLDSMGAGLMVRSRKLAQREGCKLTFTGAQPPVLNVLKLARLEEFVLGETDP